MSVCNGSLILMPVMQLFTAPLILNAHILETVIETEVAVSLARLFYYSHPED